MTAQRAAAAIESPDTFLANARIGGTYLEALPVARTPPSWIRATAAFSVSALRCRACRSSSDIAGSKICTTPACPSTLGIESVTGGKLLSEEDREDRPALLSPRCGRGPEARLGSQADDCSERPDNSNQLRLSSCLATSVHTAGKFQQ